MTASITEMLVHYQGLRNAHEDFDWGDELELTEQLDLLSRKWWIYSRYIDRFRLYEAFATTLVTNARATWEQAMWDCLQGQVTPES